MPDEVVVQAHAGARALWSLARSLASATTDDLRRATSAQISALRLELEQARSEIARLEAEGDETRRLLEQGQRHIADGGRREKILEERNRALEEHAQESRDAREAERSAAQQLAVVL